LLYKSEVHIIFIGLGFKIGHECFIVF
jgi:hypothetical protein